MLKGWLSYQDLILETKVLPTLIGLPSWGFYLSVLLLDFECIQGRGKKRNPSSIEQLFKLEGHYHALPEPSGLQIYQPGHHDVASRRLMLSGSLFSWLYHWLTRCLFRQLLSCSVQSVEIIVINAVWYTLVWGALFHVFRAPRAIYFGKPTLVLGTKQVPDKCRLNAPFGVDLELLVASDATPVFDVNCYRGALVASTVSTEQ